METNTRDAAAPPRRLAWRRLAPTRWRVSSWPDAVRSRLTSPGLTMALVGSWIALSPSLLPRTAIMTGVIVGLTMTFMYLVGVAAEYVARRAARLVGLQVSVSPGAGTALRRVWLLALMAATVWIWIASLRAQQQIGQLVGIPAGPASDMGRGLAIGVVLFLLLLLALSVLRWTWKGLSASLRVVMPRWASRMLAAAVVLALLGLAAVEGVYQPLSRTINDQAVKANDAMPGGRTQPREFGRSGSPFSNESWSSLGAHGMMVVADGPRAKDIEAFTGEPAKEPQRLFAGLRDRNIDATADAVIAEMDRTNAWDRSVIAVMTATGTGWVQEWSLQTIEYLTGGDVASVSMQYSYLGSAPAYILDPDAPAKAGKALFERVEARVQAMPKDERPRLVVGGESLGSLGGQAAFANADDMVDRVDGAVWVGTPQQTPIWSELTQHRSPGSPEIAPVVDFGKNIRFITRPEELSQTYYGAPYVPWEDPRIVYVQHPSDPIVWWSPDLLWSEPDWMKEQAGRDVYPGLRWWPFATFWQITSDMTLSIATPAGHGHNYQFQLVPAWGAALGYDPTADYSALQAWIQATIKHR